MFPVVACVVACCSLLHLHNCSVPPPQDEMCSEIMVTYVQVRLSLVMGTSIGTSSGREGGGRGGSTRPPFMPNVQNQLFLHTPVHTIGDKNAGIQAEMGCLVQLEKCSD